MKRQVDELTKNKAAFMEMQKDVKSVLYRYEVKGRPYAKWDWTIVFDRFQGFYDWIKPKRSYGSYCKYVGTEVHGDFDAVDLETFLKDRGYDPNVDYTKPRKRREPEQPVYDTEAVFVEAFAKGVSNQTGCDLGSGKEFVRWLRKHGFFLSIRDGEGIDLYHDAAAGYINDVRHLYDQFEDGVRPDFLDEEEE